MPNVVPKYRQVSSFSYPANKIKTINLPSNIFIRNNLSPFLILPTNPEARKIKKSPRH